MENEVKEVMTGGEMLEEATEIMNSLDSEPKSSKAFAIAGTVAIVGTLVAIGYKFAFKPLKAKFRARKVKKMVSVPETGFNPIEPVESKDDD